ncbi:hypothetical protein A3A46_04215 [Candidatus Roizmanbacteria bacterium RIFCSPLOWO2_01_FULL_37_13]|uniref:Triosephosphate isomerase n=1 Tax=Candidatus Roizmanbacteria bacterium RIFCSPHIGHO2_02_FULL_38_11 TaxID=1802039 RepID=A0A1F7H1H6_9BACT|nr:MAG: hypothetical protein A3C25_03220 [Candidatus Roizmanbacteria bacterium RIFCSPHIGHO2_02_FULL_38_11]OGK34908.1 MAG: hypothetical protein A3F58_03725 [Candidatus Roizmanbacteria bacterium RIFCSPHIGHO2_12_FULL_37_9b]OGK40980.1 MAG: hypothetical protein A3A46_04215 [Candidatus Roizmanbacteria bacterium RIFCSPLOWO2_01_FULL_37_13]
MKYFIANWKANKNLNEAVQWIDKFLTLPLRSDSAKVVVCPPYPLIFPLKEKIKNTKNIYLGVQDISSFEFGSYTGEVSAKTLQGLVEYVIIGHSERRKYFNENTQTLFKKTQLAKTYGIEPILCIRDEKDAIPDRVQIVAYEPVYAIGTGNNESVKKVLEMKQKLNLPIPYSFIYGGSVNKDNASSYLDSSEIDGFLVGGTSLDPTEFFKIIKLG